MFKYIGIVLAVGIGYMIYKLSEVPKLPKIKTIYRKDYSKVDGGIQPFTINISSQVLDDLNRRLSMVREFTPPLNDVGFQYGFNTNYLKKIVNFWKTKYDWKSREKYLNSLPQYKINIGELNIHYIHVKPQQTKLEIVPLLILHGWPGSVRELYDVISILTKPQPNRNFVFEVIAPSLPGYGFSDKPKDKGFNAAVVGTLMIELMSKLGIHQFYIQGGDWGAVIGANMATLYPSSILGLHSNMCFVNTLFGNLKYIVGSFIPKLFTEGDEAEKAYPLSKLYGFLFEESGYFHLQATKPDTVGVALNESPVGLAAYILEKFSTWTKKSNREHPEGNLEEKFSLTSLLDNIMIYWVTGTITSSMRLYSEDFSSTSPAYVIESNPVKVPTACARFPEELSYQPKSVLETRFKNLVRVTDFPRGGHFPAFEEPELLSNDVYESITIMKNLYIVNNNKI